MNLRDVLTKDELLELKKIKPANGVMYVPNHIYQKIRKSRVKTLLRYERGNNHASR